MAITALQSLMYRPETTGQGSRTEITRHGTVVYDGTARRFHFWHFRTRPLLEDIPVIQDNTSTEEILNIVAYRRTIMGHILEGLRGDVALVAMGIGQVEPLQERGFINAPGGDEVHHRVQRLGR